ncbi:AraC family transcriptional regulator [Vibrio rumoiensis]|uniref:AraC family transcriptional regulator n=1 Tax=Vibrio rumoiensis 1S-45 TaxID=1188252 RepID=A0A1E5DYG7_9VIBR|nr:AraC family transcriptional regulator [Vibrio rumoiensis]OEF22654.1 AraC family transcriptional regulator [Vibrio rumoiensis 1S-45]
MNKTEIQMEKVTAYIYENLDEDLNVEHLSRIACFSKYHFHRQFSLVTGIGVYKFIQALRLKRASYQLVFHPQMRIIDIALQAKFEHPESFARAFQKRFQQSPSEFRIKPNWMHWHQCHHTLGDSMSDLKNLPQIEVNIVHFDETMLAVKEHHGSPTLLNQSINEFITWRKSTGLSPIERYRTFGVVLANPHDTPEDQFRFDISGEVTQIIPDNEFGIVNKSISAGRCAVVRHYGSHDQLDNKIYALYRDWLPQSGASLRDAPLFFEYKNFFPEVSEHELVTDIYLPIC